MAALVLYGGSGTGADWLAAHRGSVLAGAVLEIVLAVAVVGTAVLVGMTLSTLKIPNTQAATGMLYVAVITTFLGELVGRLLSVGRDYAL